MQDSEGKLLWLLECHKGGHGRGKSVVLIAPWLMAMVSVVAETHVGPTGLQFCFIQVEQLSMLWKFILSL